jgi:hypothetical protein
MRCTPVACAALGIGGAAFVSPAPAYRQFGSFILDGDRVPAFVPEWDCHIEKFRRHDE